MGSPGEILSVSFYRVTNHPKTWGFKTITVYLVSDPVDWHLGQAQLLFWVVLLVSAGILQVSVASCGPASSQPLLISRDAESVLIRSSPRRRQIYVGL